jgi:ATP-dependent RNA helicase RhlE
VHRIGRTGRAGATGEAVSLVCGEEQGRLRDIERVIKRSLPRVVVAGFEPGRPGAQPPERIDQDDRPPRRHQEAPRREARNAPRSAAGGAPRAAAAGRAAPPAARDKPNAAPRPGAARFERNGPAGSAPGSARSQERRRGPARPAAEGSPLVRSNLPPGWGGSTPARRGR